uniref:TRAP transporter large permease subunit n=1 Tax=Escherichia coli TaxID=562 RepID=UPI0022807BBC
LMLWVTYFMGLVIYYVLLSWMPILMQGLGYQLEQSAMLTSLFTFGGTLGILIPPSINLVIYGVLTNSSVPKLYLAGIIPGFAMAALFMLTVMIACVAKPSWGGKKIQATWGQRF